MRVIKLGGSLFDYSGLASACRAWLAAQPVMDSLVIAGGGRLVDAIRQAQSVHHFDAQTAHWLAIRAMTATAELAAAVLSNAALVTEISEMQSLREAPHLAIVDPWQFLREEEPRLPGRPLPAGWQVTSDSIAARLASVLHAEELVLLKSGLPLAPYTYQHAAEQHYVDEYFPSAASSLAGVRCVNLRDPQAPEVILSG